MCGLCVYWYKSIFECFLSVPRKFHVDWKSLSIFNNESSFWLFGGTQTFLFLYSIVCIVYGLLQFKIVFGGWGHMWKKCSFGWKGLNIFNNRITFWLRGSTMLKFRYRYESVWTSGTWVLVLQKSYWIYCLHVQVVAVQCKRVN